MKTHAPTSPIRLLKRLLQIVLRLEDSLLIGLLLMVVTTALVQIMLRNLFDGGIVWGDVLVRVLVLWIGMVGAMVAARRGEHISIDVVTRLLPPRLRYLSSGLTHLATAAICSIVTWFSLQLVRYEYQDGLTAFAGVPVWVCVAIIPFAFAVIALRYLLLFCINLSNAAKPAL